MLGVVDRIDNELADMVTVEPVEDRVAVAPGPNQSRKSKLGQMLRHRRRSLVDCDGQSTNGSLLLQAPQDPQTCAIGQHPEHLDREVDLDR